MLADNTKIHKTKIIEKLDNVFEKYFEGKIVFLFCDKNDNFIGKWFLDNFERLKIKEIWFNNGNEHGCYLVQKWNGKEIFEENWIVHSVVFENIDVCLSIKKDDFYKISFYRNDKKIPKEFWNWFHTLIDELEEKIGNLLYKSKKLKKEEELLLNVFYDWLWNMKTENIFDIEHYNDFEKDDFYTQLMFVKEKISEMGEKYENKND